MTTPMLRYRTMRLLALATLILMTVTMVGISVLVLGPCWQEHRERIAIEGQLKPMRIGSGSQIVRRLQFEPVIEFTFQPQTPDEHAMSTELLRCDYAWYCLVTRHEPIDSGSLTTLGVAFWIYRLPKPSSFYVAQTDSARRLAASQLLPDSLAAAYVADLVEALEGNTSVHAPRYELIHADRTPDVTAAKRQVMRHLGLGRANAAAED